MASSESLKRKAPNANPQHSNARSSKRAKFNDARKILAQPPDSALGKNGDLDVAAFVKARDFEIQAIGKSVRDSKQALSTRAFQQVPTNLRRRTASHNVKKVPKRLRIRAAREIKDDNTPTGAARRKKRTPHQRIRLEKAKQLKAKGGLAKAKREAAKKDKPGVTDPEKMVQLAPRLPRSRKNTLSAPAKPSAKYRKRQIHKSWLPTHIWHAKRARMTEPKNPLWRFAIPLTPTEKCYRTTHRAATMRGCVAWDTSYMSTIGIEGVEASILGLMRSIGVVESVLTGKGGARWRNGSRSWQGWLRERDPDENWIAPANIVWRAQDEHEISGPGVSEDIGKKPKRNLLLRVHPSAFFAVWNEIVKVAKIQRPQIMVEDLRFEVGSIEVTGPGSTEALVGALHPLVDQHAALNEARDVAHESMTDADNSDPIQEDWEDIESPSKVWSKLVSLTNPSSLPANALLAFNITDPRLRHPPRTVAIPTPEEAMNKTLVPILGSWPPDQSQQQADIYDRSKRLTASRLLASQKAINRRKGLASPGQYPTASPKDPKIPILLLASRPSSNGSTQGSWTLLLPWDCVLPVWYSLMHYPLSTGDNPRFGCLEEKQQIAFEQGETWFPGDFPGTKAGWSWEMREREYAKREWDRKPKGRRIEFASIDLGEGRKGEIGQGWACDWDRLVLGKEAADACDAARDAALHRAAEDAGLASQPTEKFNHSIASTKTSKAQSTAPMSPSSTKEPPAPPPNLQHFPASLLSSLTSPIPPTALTPIHINPLSTSHPARNARIYRLPTTSPALLERWRALASPPINHHYKQIQLHSTYPKRSGTRRKSSLPAHVRAQALAASLLQPPPTPSSDPSQNPPPKPNDPTYPPVPDEKDLIGFVTSARYHLGAGRCEAIGNVLVARALNLDIKPKETVDPNLEDAEAVGQIGGNDVMSLPRDTGMVRGGKQQGAKDRVDERSERGRDAKPAKRVKGGLCIIRESGQALGRLARWEFASC